MTDLFVVDASPADGAFTSRTVDTTKYFRCLRHLSPTAGDGNVAEVRFFGTAVGSLAATSKEGR